jgi:hypothetical protein
MLVLVLVGLVAGVLTSVSPCVLPVLPVVLTASVPSHTGAGPSGAAAHDDTGRRKRSWRPYGVVAGLVLSFSVATLFGSLLLTALHLPANLLRVVGIAVLVVIGLSFIWRPFGELLERPFARLTGRQVNPESNGLDFGHGAGTFVRALRGAGIDGHLGGRRVPPVQRRGAGADGCVRGGSWVATAGDGARGESLGRRLAVVRRNAPRLRTAGGVVMIVLARRASCTASPRNPVAV